MSPFLVKNGDLRGAPNQLSGGHLINSQILNEDTFFAHFKGKTQQDSSARCSFILWLSGTPRSTITTAIMAVWKHLLFGASFPAEPQTFFFGHFLGIYFFWRVGFSGFAMVLIIVLLFSYKRFIPCGLEREVLFENVVIRHTLILILPTSQTKLWTGICCSREFCSLSKLNPDTPNILLSTGGGRAHKRALKPLPQSVSQSAITGEKNLVNGRSKKEG